MSSRRSTRVRRILNARNAAVSDTAGSTQLALHGAHVDAGILKAARMLQVAGPHSRAGRAAQLRGLDGVGPLDAIGGRSFGTQAFREVRRMASSMVVLIRCLSLWRSGQRKW
jgi:hypothetical protein